MYIYYIRILVNVRFFLAKMVSACTSYSYSTSVCVHAYICGDIDRYRDRSRVVYPNNLFKSYHIHMYVRVYVYMQLNTYLQFATGLNSIEHALCKAQGIAPENGTGPNKSPHNLHETLVQTYPPRQHERLPPHSCRWFGSVRGSRTAKQHSRIIQPVQLVHPSASNKQIDRKQVPILGNDDHRVTTPYHTRDGQGCQ